MEAEAGGWFRSCSHQKGREREEDAERKQGWTTNPQGRPRDVPSSSKASPPNTPPSHTLMSAKDLNTCACGVGNSRPNHDGACNNDCHVLLLYPKHPVTGVMTTSLGMFPSLPMDTHVTSRTGLQPSGDPPPLPISGLTPKN